MWASGMTPHDCYVCSTCGQYAAEPVDIGSRRELFVDHFLVEKLDGTELRLHRPVDEGRVLAFDAPWEGPFCAYVTVINAPDKFQMYYRGFRDVASGDQDKNQVTCYAESPDGISWTRSPGAPGLDVSDEGWDSQMVCYPFVLDHGGRRYMFYNGNGYGRTGFGVAVLEG